MDQEHPTIYNNMDDQKNKQVSYNKTQFTPEKKQIILEHLLITKKSIENTKNYSHVPCKFFKQGNCTAGNSCPFSHSLDFNEANKRPCKYFKFGNCKFGNKCANSHVLPKSYPATKTTTTNQVSLSSVNYNNNNNNNRNISIEYKSATLNNKSYLNKNGNIHSFYPHLNNNIMTNNSIYYRPSYNQLISKPSFPLTPPSPPPPFQLSSSSSSSIHSSLSPSIPFSNSYIPKHFNTLYPTDNNCNHISTHINVNNKHTPIMFTKIEEEENINDQPMEESHSNVYHLTYSSILNNLEKEDNENIEEEEEEDFQFMYQQSSFNNPTSTQYQQFKFDDL